MDTQKVNYEILVLTAILAYYDSLKPQSLCETGFQKLYLVKNFPITIQNISCLIAYYEKEFEKGYDINDLRLSFNLSYFYVKNLLTETGTYLSPLGFKTVDINDLNKVQVSLYKHELTLFRLRLEVERLTNALEYYKQKLSNYEPEE